jgi:hypothetical protein
LGEYYTPDWLAEFTMDRSGYEPAPGVRLLDPACGSGTFLVTAIKRMKVAAAERGLIYEPIGTLPDVTPLVRSASGKAFSSVMQGNLGQSTQGYAAMISHNAPDNDVGDSTIQTTYDQIVLAEVPQANSFISTLVVSASNRLQPLPRENLREISTESEAVNRRQRVWIGPGTDEGRMRQLLSPVTLEWLAGTEHPGFAFEIDHGWISAWSRPSIYVPMVNPGKPEELGSLIVTTNSLVDRVLAEIAE